MRKRLIFTNVKAPPVVTPGHEKLTLNQTGEKIIFIYSKYFAFLSQNKVQQVGRLTVLYR